MKKKSCKKCGTKWAGAISTCPKCQDKEGKTQRDYHAKLVMHGLPDYPKKGLKMVAKWLRVIADEIEEDPKSYSKVATWRIMK